MTKTELVAAVAEQAGLSRQQADGIVSAFVEQVTNALSRGESVTLVGFGSFQKSHRKARAGHHPQTGAPMEIAATNSVNFKPGKGLRDAVKN